MEGDKTTAERERVDRLMKHALSANKGGFYGRFSLWGYFPPFPDEKTASMGREFALLSPIEG